MNRADNPSDVSCGVRSLRIGVMNRRAELQEWQARCLTNLIAIDRVQVAISITVSDTPPALEQVERPLFKRLLSNIYFKYLGKSYATRTSDTALLLNRPSIRCSAIKDSPVICLSDDDIVTINTYELDVILWFGHGAVGGEILRVPRFGVWSFSHCDGRIDTAGVLGFWEIYADDCSVGAALQKLTDQDDSRIILKKGTWGVYKYSHGKTIDEILLETAQWPARVCADILNGNGNYVAASPCRVSTPEIRIPTNWQLLRFLLILLKNRLIKTYNSLFCHDQWNIGIAYEPIHAFLHSRPTIHYLPCPEKGMFVADPFGILKGKQLTIICEYFTYKSSKGIVSSIELVDSIKPRPPMTVLDLPVHVSYPYLIEYDGEIYCIPETAGAREVALYKAETFPHEWIKVAILVEGLAASDATVFQYEGLWWLMCADREKNPFANLFAWYALDLFGPWKPHQANPIKTDIRSARSAGTPFSYNGYLYRPAQDCSRTYGGRIVINRVLQLTPNKFTEVEVATVDAAGDSPYPDGIHTLSSVGDMTLVDGKRVVFVGNAFKRTVFRGLAKMFQFTSLKRILYASS
jgi:hypothetical protein